MNSPLLTSAERSRYAIDLYRNLLRLSEGKPVEGLTRELDAHLRAVNPRERDGDAPGDILIPIETLMASRSALNASTFAGGGALVGDEVFPALPLLRPKSCCLRAGAQFVSGLRGNVTVPSEVQEVTMQWLAPQDAATSSTSSFQGLSLSPKRLTGLTSISRELDIQTAGVIVSFVLDSLARGIAAALDRAALAGSGLHGEPLGIFGVDGTQKVVLTTYSSWADAVSFERMVADANADLDSFSFIGAPDVKETWRKKRRFDAGNSGDQTLWQRDECADRPAQTSTNVESGNIVGGDFSKLVFAAWGDGVPVGLLVDRYTAKRTATIELLATIYADAVFTKPAVFAINQGSAIQ